jgi:cytosine/adenosine deaminase-related metal-dependent hydrolase
MVAVVVATGLAACTGAEPGGGEAFDPDENDEHVGVAAGGKADGAGAAYRDGCGAPIRSGRYALLGDVIVPTGVLPRAYVVVDGERIVEVRTREQGKPTDGTMVIDTRGVIAPGLIDGHSHVEYNHIPLADLGRRYQNREQWPNAPLYKTLVKDPKNAVTAANLKCQALKHGEARALVGGTTAIQGTPELSCVRPLVRNLEQTNFCRDRVRQNVTSASGFNRSISGKPSFADSIKSDIAANKIDAFVVHIGEGIDDFARGEWETMKALDLARPEAVMIHTAAFTRAQYAEVAKAGAKIVWSPLSNMLLYGATADIPSALAEGVLVSLGADWAPSGSANLLGELKVADRINKGLWGGAITDEQLVQMVTINPAIAFGIDDVVGSIEPGKLADLVVVRKRTGVSAYRTLIEAGPRDVWLVAVSGDPLFGTQSMMDRLGKTGDYEIIDACGVPRAIDVTVTATDVQGGGESLASTEERLRAVNPKLTPIVDCSDEPMRKAFAGTALEMPAITPPTATTPTTPTTPAPTTPTTSEPTPL